MPFIMLRDDEPTEKFSRVETQCQNMNMELTQSIFPVSERLRKEVLVAHINSMKVSVAVCSFNKSAVV